MDSAADHNAVLLTESLSTARVRTLSGADLGGESQKMTFAGENLELTTSAGL